MYRQCLLKKRTMQQVAWIPAEFAKRGRFVRIGSDDGWLVAETWGTLPGVYVIGHQFDHRTAFPSLG